MQPATRPKNPQFSSGPCAKRPGWSLGQLAEACVGRSHRSAEGKAKLAAVIDRSRKLLGLPADYRLGIVPASDTGAVEMALWSLLGARGVDLLAWESFGKGWVADVVQQLKLKDVRSFEADRQGLTICDATSAAFAMNLPWDKLDVVTWSWQKVLGGEAAHGMIALSPRAVARLESHKPAWPLPKIFQLSKGGKLIDGIFKGDTINTPSMLAVEDALDGLRWAEAIGGLPALIARSEANLAAIAGWVARTPWIEFLAEDAAIRSPTSVCLKMSDAKAAGGIADLLAKEGVAYDIGAYRDAPPGLRIWGGATVETADLQALFPWLDWAWAELHR